MRDHYLYDYATIRIVPRVEREEFINVGVILSCPACKFLDVRIEVDATRLAALDPGLDIAAIREQLESWPRICVGGPAAGPIRQLTQRERFNWLVSPKSTIIQTSPVHTGWCTDPPQMLEHLFQRMVHPPG